MPGYKSYYNCCPLFFHRLVIWFEPVASVFAPGLYALQINDKLLKR